MFVDVISCSTRLWHRCTTQLDIHIFNVSRPTAKFNVAKWTLSQFHLSCRFEHTFPRALFYRTEKKLDLGHAHNQCGSVRQQPLISTQFVTNGRILSYQVLQDNFYRSRRLCSSSSTKSSDNSAAKLNVTNKTKEVHPNCVFQRLSGTVHQLVG